jgi:hypothetical protein
MKYALVNDCKVHIKNVERGTIGSDCWFSKNAVKACKGHYKQYWKYIDEKPVLPEGYENETDWHVAWKDSLRDEYVEVICGENNEHRADIKTPEYVIEIQKSPISYDAAKERSLFYSKLNKDTRMLWIVNAYSACSKRHISTTKTKDNRLLVNWKYKKMWVADISGFTSTHVYLDLSPKSKNMLRIWKHEKLLYGNWESKEVFFNKYIAPYSDSTYENFYEQFQSLKASDY